MILYGHNCGITLITIPIFLEGPGAQSLVFPPKYWPERPQCAQGSCFPLKKTTKDAEELETAGNDVGKHHR